MAFSEVVLLVSVMLYRDHRLFDRAFISGVSRIISVSGFSMVAGYIMLSIYPLGIQDSGFFTLGGKLLLIASVVFTVHISVSSLFGLEEVRPIFAKLKNLIIKPVRIDIY